jgi:hypothetical protein
MLFKRTPSLSWWRFAIGMAFFFLPLGFVFFVLARESDPAQIAVVMFVSASAVGYVALRWRALRKQFNGDADTAAAAIKQNPFAAVGSPRLFIVWWLCTSLVVIAAAITWALWNTLH